MRKFTFTREFYAPKGATKIADKQSDAVVYVYETAGVVYAAGFHGKAAKPDWHHRFKTAASREKHILDFFAGRRASLEAAQARRTERAKPHNWHVGMVLKSSWGYDQTNVDFYQVTKIVGARAVEIRPIAQVRVGASEGAEYVMPDIDNFTGPAIRKLVNYDRVKIESYASAYPWKATPAYQTAFGAGH